MSRSAPPPSRAPFFWLLFGAGGMLAALVLPALVFFSGVVAPLAARLFDTELLAHARVLALLGSPLARLLCAGFIAALCWHAAHRIGHLWHDLSWPGARLAARLCYALALAASVAAVVLVALLPPPA